MILWCYLALAVISVGIFWISIKKLNGVVQGYLCVDSSRSALLSLDMLISFFSTFFVVVLAGLTYMIALSYGNIKIYTAMITFVILSSIVLILLIWWRVPFAALYKHQSKQNN